METRIHVRTNEEVKRLLKQAAKACQKSLSEFILDNSLKAAEQTLADRRIFEMDDKQWKAFQKVLDRPVQTSPNLKKLLREKGVFDD